MPNNNSFPFTKRALDNLPPPTSGRAVYYDQSLRGLSLRVSATGGMTFTILGRPRGGAVERVTLGRYPKMSLAAARERAAEILAAFASGTSKAEQEREERQQKTLGEIATAYFSDREREGKRSIAAMRMSYQLYLGALPNATRRAHGRTRSKPSGAANWEQRKPTQLHPDDVKRLRAGLAESCGRCTANRSMQLLRAILNFGRKHGYLARDHAADLVDAVEMFPETQRTRRLSGDEVRRFFAELAGETNPGFRDFLSLLLFTGARRTNVMAMRWQEIDMNLGTWEIPGAKAKAGQAMVIPLSSGALEVLRRRSNGATKDVPWVFPAPARSGHMEAPKKPWAAFRKRAGMPDVRLHDIRRTLGSWMIDTGAPLAVIGKQLGHRDSKSTAIYARLDVEPVRAAVERAELALRAAAITPAVAKVVSLAHHRKSS